MINLSDLEALAVRAGEPTVDGLNARDLLVSLMPEVVAELRAVRCDRRATRLQIGKALIDTASDFGGEGDDLIVGSLNAFADAILTALSYPEDAHPPRDKFHIEVFDAGLKPSEWNPVTAPFPTIELAQEFQGDSTSVRNRLTRIVRERRTYTVIETEDGG